MFNLRVITLVLTVALCGAALTVAPLASAKDGNDVRVRGVCTQGSTAKLKLSRETAASRSSSRSTKTATAFAGRSRCVGTDRSSLRRRPEPMLRAARSPSVA